MTGLTFQPVFPPWLMAVAVAVLLLLPLVLRPSHGHLSRGRQLGLAALRLAVGLMALLAMLRPTLVYTESRPQRAALLLLLDDSRSMAVADALGNTSRWDSLQSLLAASADDLARLAEKLDLKVFLFDESLRPVVLQGGRLELPAAPAGEQTALGAAIEDAMSRETTGRVRGVIALSDGAQRAAAPRDLPPQVAVRRLAAEAIPLFALTFGQPGGSNRADLSVDDLVTSDTIFAQAPTEVRAQLRARGYANQTVRVQLLWETSPGNMEVVDTVQVTTTLGGEPQPVSLRHTPTAAGEHKVTVRVETREGETVTANNETSTFVTVREGGLRVAYWLGTKRIGGGPGPEQRFIRDALAASPEIVVTRRVFDYREMQLDVRADVAPGSFDVMILDDLDAMALTSGSWDAIADRVVDGAGLMMIGGYHSFGPGGFADTPLARVLPVGMGRAERQPFGEPPRDDVHLGRPVQMVPAARQPGQSVHPVMQLAGAEENLSAWRALPPLDGGNRFERGRLNLNATVLAETDDAERNPLLVAAQPGAGRVLAFAGDTTWKWRQFGHRDAHRRFWRQCILWLASQDEAATGRIWITLGGRRVPRGGGLDVQAGINDEHGQRVTSPRLTVELVAPDGTVSPVRTIPAATHLAATIRETLVPGDYVVRAQVEDGGAAGGAQLEPAQARFLVPEQDLELEYPAADPALMAQLAEATADAGGEALAPEELPALFARLAAEPQEIVEEVLAKVTFWDTWPFLLMFVGLLGVEWYLRKRWGMV